MAWVNPRAWAVGETPTNAMLNQDLRDDAQWLFNGASAYKIGNNTGTAVVAGVGINVAYTDKATDPYFEQGITVPLPSTTCPTPLAGYWWNRAHAAISHNNAAAAHRVYVYQNGTIRFYGNASGTTNLEFTTSVIDGIYRFPDAAGYWFNSYLYGGSGTTTVVFTADAAFIRGL